MAPRTAHAIRPFITDDARVVGRAHLQLETWWRSDRSSFQHWAIPAFGPTDWLELSLGGFHGVARLDTHNRYSVAGPLGQAKVLLHPAKPNGLPGFAAALGALPPFGHGYFTAPGLQPYGYLAATESLFDRERLLIHANVGFAATVLEDDTDNGTQFTWGIGGQLRLLGDLHLVGEMFSGDPYVTGTGGAVQGGFRYLFTDNLQVDGTTGGGVFGDTVMPPWFSTGVRLVSNDLF